MGLFASTKLMSLLMFLTTMFLCYMMPVASWPDAFVSSAPLENVTYHKLHTDIFCAREGLTSDTLH